MNIPKENEPADLGTRVFNNFYFQIVWIILMASVLKLVWPLQNALLVLWVYGADGYFHEGIRVTKNKPTIFSNGVRSPDLPNFVTGLGVFFITVGGLSLLMLFILRAYERFRLKQKDQTS